MSSLHIYSFVVSRAFMAGAASQAGDADSSWAPGLTSGLQGSVNVHRGVSIVGATVTVHQFFCILFICKSYQRHLPSMINFQKRFLVEQLSDHERRTLIKKDNSPLNMFTSRSSYPWKSNKRSRSNQANITQNSFL